MTVGVHIRGDNCDECLACIIATKHFFEQSIDFMHQHFHRENYNNVAEHKENNTMYLVVIDSIRDIGGF